MSHLALHVAASLFTINVAVGLCAQFGRRRFGWVHHALYAVVFASAAVAWWVEREPALLVTLAALVFFPLAKPRTWLHPVLAVVGLAGYLGAYL